MLSFRSAEEESAVAFAGVHHLREAKVGFSREFSVYNTNLNDNDTVVKMGHPASTTHT